MQIKDGQVRRERRKEVTRMTYTQVETPGECPAHGVPVGGGGL